MKTEKHRKLNLVIHCIVILTFLLPFFYTGCGRAEDNQGVSIATDSLATDSVATEVFENQPDSSNTISNDTLINKDITNISSKDTLSDKSLSIRLAYKYPFLKIILTPKDEEVSGLGVIINYCEYIPFLLMLVLSFTIIISLISKIIEKQALKLFIFIDSLSFILLIFSASPAWNNERLWGYWVCLTSIMLLVIHDIYKIKITKR